MIDFISFLKKYTTIKIPKIQREYVQGNDEKGQIFVDDIFSCIKNDESRSMDLIYGDTNEDEFHPIDGQQRLTTLFLLYWYIGLVEDEPDWKELKKFTYDTRESSKDFCRALCEIEKGRVLGDYQDPSDPDTIIPESILPEDIVDFQETIVRQPWFYTDYRYDPTIKSMLAMLDKIHLGYKEYIKQNKTKVTYAKLNKLFQFNLLDMKKFTLGEEFYVIMNDRGKPLSAYENFKSALEKWMRNCKDNEVNDFFSEKIDGKDRVASLINRLDRIWTENLWNRVNNDNAKTDRIMYLFFCRYFYSLLTRLVNPTSKNDWSEEVHEAFDFFEKEDEDHYRFDSFKLVLDKTVINKDTAKIFYDNLYCYLDYLFGNNDVANELVRTRLLMPIWDKTTTYTRVLAVEGFNKGDYTFLSKPVLSKAGNEEVDLSKDCKMVSSNPDFGNGVISIKQRKEQIKIEYEIDSSKIEDMDFGDSLVFNEKITDMKSHEVIISEIETKVSGKEDYKDILWDSINDTKGFPMVSRAINYACQLYVEQNHGVDVKSDSWKRWKRFAWNIIESQDVRRSEKNLLIVYKIFNRLKDKVNSVYDELLCMDNKGSKSAGNANDYDYDSLRYEIHKAHYYALGSKWYDHLKVAEAHPYLKGYIDFLLINGDGKDSCDEFDKRKDVAYAFFDESGLKNNIEIDNKNDYLILRSLLSKTDFSKIEYDDKKKPKNNWGLTLFETSKQNNIKTQLKNEWKDAIRELIAKSSEKYVKDNGFDKKECIKELNEQLNNTTSSLASDPNLKNIEHWREELSKNIDLMDKIYNISNQGSVSLNRFVVDNKVRDIRIVLGTQNNQPMIPLNERIHYLVEKIMTLGFDLADCDNCLDKTKGATEYTLYRFDYSGGLRLEFKSKTKERTIVLHYPDLKVDVNKEIMVDGNKRKVEKTDLIHIANKRIDDDKDIKEYADAMILEIKNWFAKS